MGKGALLRPPPTDRDPPDFPDPEGVAFVPSEASVRAALSPAAGDWLYFVVVSKDGTEAFSDTLAGQEANEQLAKSRGLS